MKRILILILLIASFNLAQAQTQEKSQASGYHQHDGFYLSMCLGPVIGNIDDNVFQDPVYGKYEIIFSGTGTQFDFKIGGAIGENLILHATIISSSIVNPKAKISSYNNNVITTSNGVTLGEAMTGVGLTYYIMPSNIFLSGSVGLGNFTLTSSDDSKSSITTNRGFSMQLKAGKEWWISKNWGFGIGFTYGITNLTNKSDGIEEEMDSNRFGILFNTTFN